MVISLDFVAQYPHISIIAMAGLMSLFITVVNFFFLDKERMRDIKVRQKEIQAKMKEHQKAGEHDKALALNKELMSGIGETFRHSMKPTIITIVPTIIFFYFIKDTFADTILAGTWFWWYLVSAIAFSMIFRKVFRLP